MAKGVARPSISTNSQTSVMALKDGLLGRIVAQHGVQEDRGEFGRAHRPSAALHPLKLSFKNWCGFLE